MNEIIRVENLEVGYEGEAVLKDLNFSVQPGEITVILGKSGCGKTTILKTLIGLVPPYVGQVYFSGEQVDYSSESSLENLFRRIGVLYQGGALLNSFTLFENVSLPLRMHYPGLPKEIEQEMVYAKLSQVGLLESRDKYPAELSGGMRKRAALARAMIGDPEIVFCDEPSAGLDPITARELDSLMLNLKDNFGITFLVVTHELRSIEAIANKALVLNDGGLLFFGDYGDMAGLNDSFIDSFFLKKQGRKS